MKVCMLINLVFIIVLTVMVFISKTPFAKVLSNRLLITCLVTEIVFYAVHINSSMVLDIAIAIAVLGFVDVQFLSVFLRRKGDF